MSLGLTQLGPWILKVLSFSPFEKSSVLLLFSSLEIYIQANL